MGARHRAALLDAALGYATLGWPVFPLAPNEKQPLYASPHRRKDPLRSTCKGECGRMGHGCHDATTDQDVILGWWRRTPSANLGIATGAPGPDILDVDVKDDMPGLASLRTLATLGMVAGEQGQVSTASGGLHLYYEGTVDQGNGRLPKQGLDFRSSGGYVVAPPSVVAGRYWRVLRWTMSDRVLRWEGIKNHFAPPRPARRHQTPPGGPANVGATVASLARWMGSRERGNRNDGLFWAACKAIESGATAADLDDLRDAALSVGLPANEVDQTINSALRKT